MSDVTTTMPTKKVITVGTNRVPQVNVINNEITDNKPKNRKVITVGQNKVQETTSVEVAPSGIPTWEFPSEKKDSKPTEYTICVTETDHSNHRMGKMKTKGEFNPLAIQGTTPRGLVAITKVEANNMADALEQAHEFFYSIYVEGDVNH